MSTEPHDGPGQAVQAEQESRGLEAGRFRSHPLKFLFALIGIAFLMLGCATPSGPDLADLGDQLQAVLDAQRAEHGSPGITAAVVVNGDPVWVGASGISSESEPMNPEMLFGLGSVSKTYIAALVLQLAEEGHLSVDDSLGQWLPRQAETHGNITIHQLLNHTSGLYRYQQKPEYLSSILAEPARIWTPQEIAETFDGASECAPGACWGESAMDYVLLGMIIEQSTGSSVSQVLRERFLGPMQLDQTYLYPDEPVATDRLAHFWWDLDGSGELIDALAQPADVPLASLSSSLWASGAIYATAEDLARWAHALFNAEVLSDTSLAQMLSQGPEIAPGLHYGYSVISEKIGESEVFWHSGGAGYASLYYSVPESGVTVAVLCNLMVDPKPIAVELYEAYQSGQETNLD